jgi:hypothetical protein
MSRHLSAERIHAWTMGERAAEDERHVAECARCAAEVAHLEDALAAFRGSVRRWSELRDSGPLAAPAVAPRPRAWPRWATAAAIVIVAAVVSVSRAPQRAPSGAVIASPDAQLLEQVDAHVSRPVPRPMEPLLDLVSWDLSAQRISDGKENDGTIKKQ